MLIGTIIPRVMDCAPKDIIWNPDAEYNCMFSLDELRNPICKRILEEIDDDYIKEYPDGGAALYSSVYGNISYRDISTGAKTMMVALFMKEGRVLSEHMGSNCFPLLSELCEDRDVHIYLTHTPRIEFKIHITNFNKTVTDKHEISLMINKIQGDYLYNLRGPRY